jgi:hypothetical protein
MKYMPAYIASPECSTRGARSALRSACAPTSFSLARQSASGQQQSIGLDQAALPADYSWASQAHDTASERLRGWTRNPLGSARMGSNPLGVAYIIVRHQAFAHDVPGAFMRKLSNNMKHQLLILLLPTIVLTMLALTCWPRGPMEKASAHGAGDCRFEPCRGHFHLSLLWRTNEV